MSWYDAPPQVVPEGKVNWDSVGVRLALGELASAQPVEGGKGQDGPEFPGLSNVADHSRNKRPGEPPGTANREAEGGNGGGGGGDAGRETAKATRVWVCGCVRVCA